MKGRVVVWLLMLGVCGAHAMAADGLINVQSRFDPKATIARLEAQVSARSMTVFARVDHQAAAKQSGMSLRPTFLLVFGNATAGTPLMQAVQTIGIDLPLKALVWQDSNGVTWISYNDPHWLAKRHGLGSGVEPTVDAMSAALQEIVRKAASSD